MELTQEHFDSIIKTLATKVDLDTVVKTLATKADLDATKSDLKTHLQAQTVELKVFAQEQTESLARIIAESIDKPLQMQQAEINFLKEKVVKLEAQVANMTLSFRKIEHALNIPLLEQTET